MSYWSGKKHSPEARKKMSLSHIGLPSGRKGKKASPETIEKMRLANIGKKHSNLTKLRMSRAQKKVIHTPEWNKKVGIAIKGIKNGNWKGNRVSYSALHDWVRYYLGKPNKCEECGTTTAKRYDWANKSFQYKRDLNDWIRLCRSCHIRKDKNDKSQRRISFV